VDDETRQQFQALSALVESVKESLEREIQGVKASLQQEIGGLRQSMERIDTRLDKIAAGAHYVTRLVE